MLLSTDLTSAPDDDSIGIEYCQKICLQVSPILMLILHTKSIADTVRQLSKSITDTIGSNTDTVILRTL